MLKLTTYIAHAKDSLDARRQAPKNGKKYEVKLLSLDPIHGMGSLKPWKVEFALVEVEDNDSRL